jgi:hypothetical protein
VQGRDEAKSPRSMRSRWMTLSDASVSMRCNATYRLERRGGRDLSPNCGDYEHRPGQPDAVAEGRVAPTVEQLVVATVLD